MRDTGKKKVIGEPVPGFQPHLPKTSCLEATDLWMTAESIMWTPLTSLLQSRASHCPQLKGKSRWVSHSPVMW